jgi:hypothetical protein
MDFFYDKLQMPAETPPPTGGDESMAGEGHRRSPSSIDVAADKLEIGIEQAYEKIAASSWGSSRWGSVWESVKKQGEAALRETKKDFEAVKSELGVLLDKPAQEEDSVMDSSQETVKEEAPKTMLSELTKRAQAYIDELDRDLEKIENAAGSYAVKLGKDVKSFLKDAVTVSAPGEHSGESESESGEDAPAEILFDVPEAVQNQIYSTRLDAQLHALHTSQQPFLTTSYEPDFDKFAESFDIEAHTGTIAADLDQYKPLRSLMESLVPDQVPYNEFWAKYYYMKKQIHDQEQKRKLLLQQATTEDNQEVAWDESDDEAEPEPEPKESERTSSDGSYDVVSKTSSVVDLANKPDPKPKVDEKKHEEDDEDEDWE